MIFNGLIISIACECDDCQKVFDYLNGWQFCRKNSYRIRIKVRWCIDSSLQKIFWKFIQHTHLQTLVHFLRLPHTPMHTCAYPTHPHTQAHTHSHLHTPMYMYAQPHPPTYMYIYLHTPVHTCAHLCTPVHTCAHQRTPTHTRKYHTHTRWCP